MTETELTIAVEVAPEPKPEPMPGRFLFDVFQAAEYCDLSVASIRYHIYRTENLVPDGRIGRNLVFTRETLDEFKAVPRIPGRKAAPEPEVQPAEPIPAD